MKINHKGFSLLEVIVAINVLGLFLISLTTVLTNLQILNDRAKDLTTANGFAEQKIEALRSADYVALSDGTIDFTDELPDSLAPPKSGVYVVSSLNDSVKRVDVTISYNEAGSTRTVEYATLVGELGVGQQ